MTSLARTIVGSGPRLVLCHGFTQTSASWGDFGHALAENNELVELDLPGHGRSGEIATGFLETADLIGEAVAAPYGLLGYSMGGRLALATALGTRPPSHLVLIGATAGISDALEQERRRSADERLAAQIEADGVEAFLARWLSQPMFEHLTIDSDDLDGRRSNTAVGLSRSLRALGVATQPDLWGHLDQITVPTLLLTGERDHKFCTIADELAASIPHATVAVVPEAGHACHLEAPHATARLVDVWLHEHR